MPVDVVRGQRLLDEFDVEPGDRLEPIVRRREVPGAVDVDPEADVRARPRRGWRGSARPATSVSRSAPALTLSVRKPDSTDCCAASAAADGPSDGSVALTPTPSSSGSASGSVQPHFRSRPRSRARPARQVEPRALERGVERSARRPRAPRARRDRRQPPSRGALDRLPDERRRGSCRPPRRPPVRATASPSPTRPSASTSRRIHASRSTHIPVAVANGRRNGMRTRSATRARRRSCRSRPDRQPEREQDARRRAPAAPCP